ncbi:MAG TPA: NAD(P)H-dependent oxidoreductase [Caldimonas sp.]|nr:NAD(P)H-dependent oxidoreductase [Caldimonas sp.]
MSTLRIGILTGSTRPGRTSESVARWVHQMAQDRQDAQFELVDIAAYELPLFDEPLSPTKRKYTRPHTFVWSERIAPFDGYVFVTPEYNHSISGALKNAIDFLYHEWSHKAAGIVSYGGRGSGARAAEHLRGVMGSLMVATVRKQVLLSTYSDFDPLGTFTPLPQRRGELMLMLDEIVSIARALRPARSPADGGARSSLADAG